jgi:hypothetical protein
LERRAHVEPSNRLGLVAEVLGSALVGAVFGLIFFLALAAFGIYTEVVIIAVAAMVALSVSILIRYRKALIGPRKSRFWLPTMLGTFSGGMAGCAVVWFQLPVSRLLISLLVGAVASGVASFVAEIH